MATTSYCGRCLTSFAGDLAACPNLACGAHRPDEGWGVLLGPGDLLDRHYRIERCLAVGGAGLTYLAREVGVDGDPTGPKLAVKVLYAARAAGPFLRRLANEAQILQELAHEHLVQLRGFVHRAGHEPYLVTRFEEGGSLAQHIDRVGRVSPRVAAGILRQILLALDVAHQRGVVHRDLKPDNVLLSAPVPAEVVPHCRVADFGIAKVSGGVSTRLTRQGAFVGTPEYAAPEQFAGQQPTPATDVFAVGGLLVFLLMGRPPVSFTQRGDIETSHDELLEQLPPRLDPGAITADPSDLAVLQRIVDHTMVRDAPARWTIQQTLLELRPLVTRNGAPRSTLDVTGMPGPARSQGLVGVTERDPSLTFVVESTDEQRALPPPVLSDTRGVPGPSDGPSETLAPSETEERQREALEASYTPPPAPPPFLVPTTPPQIPAAPLQDAAPAVEAASGGGVAGAAAGVAGCMGLSVMGMVAVGLGGASLVGLILVAGAWGMGWFGPGGTTDPIVVVDDLDRRLMDAPTLSGPELARVRQAVRAIVPQIGRICGRGATVGAQVLVDANGQVVHAVVDRRGLGKVKPECVTKGLLQVQARDVDTEGKTEVAFQL